MYIYELLSIPKCNVKSVNIDNYIVSLKYIEMYGVML